MKAKNNSAKRLWDKGEPSDALMQTLTVGDDPQLDLNLVGFDCVGSAAHARMLRRAGLLSSKDLSTLLRGLREIFALSGRNRFPIPVELEDAHTAIETWLSKRVGEPALRIHTARSRNDQVLLAMRLYTRSQVLSVLEQLGELVGVIESRFKKFEKIALPGYTHMQPAMPSSVGMWLHALYEELLAVSHRGTALLESLDRCPLGGAAGFGVPFKNVDQEYTAKLLGFSRTFRSPIHANNSRGRDELLVVSWLCEIAGVLEKFIWDMMLFTSREFQFFSLPSKLTTGSSIMPQKRNPDLLELARARCSRLRGVHTELAWVVGKLPTSYHRDLQLSKGPVMRGFREISELLTMVELALRGFKVDAAACSRAMEADLFATYDAYREVARGVPFREAYRATAKRVTERSLAVGDLAKDFRAIAMRTGRYMKAAVREGRALSKSVQGYRRRVTAAEKKVLL
jgi:argininosuccinate lyase